MQIEKPLSKYRKWYQKNIEHAREYKRVMMRKLRLKYPEHYREQTKLHKQKLKNALFDAYGKTCVLCGFSDVRALTLDHALNNGAEERRQFGIRGTYRRALKKEHRNEYRTLCMNCQFIKRVEAKRQNQHKVVAASAFRILSGGVI
jgi:hypothetical protein